MTEKEFLKAFLEYAEACDYDLDDNLIQTWLDYYHTAYYEVEFIEKEDESQFIYADNLIKETYADDDNPEIEWIEVESNFAKEQRYK